MFTHTRGSARRSWELLQDRHEPPDGDLAARGRAAERVAPALAAVVVVVVARERLAEHGEPREEVRLGDLRELVDLVAQVREDRQDLAQELLARVDQLERGHALGRVEVEAHGDRVVLARHLRGRVGDGELDAAQRRLVLLHENELALQLLLDRPPRLLVALLILEEEGLRVRHRRGTRDATPRLRRVRIQKSWESAPPAPESDEMTQHRLAIALLRSRLRRARVCARRAALALFARPATVEEPRSARISTPRSTL